MIEAVNCAVVRSVGEYTEPNGAMSVVASCDILDFTDGLVRPSARTRWSRPGPAGNEHGGPVGQRRSRASSLLNELSQPSLAADSIAAA